MPAPTLLTLHDAAIPTALRNEKRWSPWAAVWDAKRNKYDKIPKSASLPTRGLSNKTSDGWVDFDNARYAYHLNKQILAGVGYLMTGPHGIVGIDLDTCVSGGVIAPWALEIVGLANSYTEYSPSGNGLRIFVKGAAADWNNHEVGIEVYGGTAPRFLTVTGHHLQDTPEEVNEVSAEILLDLETRYAKARAKTEVTASEHPDVIPGELLPHLSELNLPAQTKDFLNFGTARQDRSQVLFTAAVDLSKELAPTEVFSILAHNEHAMSIAKDHRHQDEERALQYLWVEHSIKAEAKARDSKAATADDFENLKEPKTYDLSPIKDARFKVWEEDFFTRRPLDWLVKQVLPAADLAVLYGDSGSGKSFFALDLVAAIGQGIPWRGRKTRKGRTVYICAEGSGGFANRIKAYLDFHDLDFAELGMGVVTDAPDLMSRTDVVDLVKSIEKFGPVDLIVVDTLAQSFQGNENSGEDMGLVLAHCKTLKQKLGAMVLLVAHTGKDANKGVRGWSGLRAAADAQIEIVRKDSARTAVINKMKDGSGEGDKYGFNLHIVPVSIDEDGEPVTSCVVSEGEAQATTEDNKRATNQSIIRRVVDELDMLGYVDEEQLVTLCLTPDKDGATPERRNIRRALNRFIETKVLEVDGDGLVCKGKSWS